MDDLLKFVPEDKHAEFKKTYTDSGYIKGDETTLIQTVKSNQRVFDLITKDPMENRIKNFKEKDLPGLIDAARKEERETVLKEVNKPETEDQKRIRELEKRDQEREKIISDANRKSELRKLYKDIDADLAESLYGLDDDSIKSIMEGTKAKNDKIAELQKIVEYGDNPPVVTGGENITQIKRGDYDKLPPEKQHEVALKAGKGEVIITD